MLVFVETESGSKFPIEMKYWYTVPDIKKQIETVLGIPVSQQTLSFKGTLLLRDDIYLQLCYNIVEKSTLQLFVRLDHEPNQTNNQALRQTEQPPAAPSSSTEELLYGEDRPLSTQVMSNVNVQSYWPVTTGEGGINIQDLSGTNNTDQDLLQRELSKPSNSYGSFVLGEDRPFSTEHFTNIQDSSGRNNSKQDLLQREPSSPSNSFGGFVLGDEDRPLSTEHFTNIQSYWPGSATKDIISSDNQVFDQTEQFPPSNPTEQQNISPIKEIINIPDSPVKVVRRAKKPPQKLRVTMFPYSREKKPVSKFTLDVVASENVQEVRKELEKLQEMSALDLPKEGYFFIHHQRQRVLDEDQSFRWNGVAHGDTIEIFPGYVTRGG